MSSLTIHAHIGAERGEISAMTRKLEIRWFSQPSWFARRKTRSGMALMERMPWEYILLRRPRTSLPRSSSFPKGKSDMSNFSSLVEIMSRLRGEGGCEWDRAQTHATLRQYLLEETHEVVDAISRKNMSLLCEELGDLLLQILFHAQIAGEKGEFTITAVIESISEKMVRRHPHVFSDASAAP